MKTMIINAHRAKSFLVPLLILSTSVLSHASLALSADGGRDAQAQASALLDPPVAHSALDGHGQLRRADNRKDAQTQAQNILLPADTSGTSKTFEIKTPVRWSGACRASCTHQDAQESARRLLSGQSQPPSSVVNERPAASSLSRAKVR
jgi:hypothetical protein